MFMKPKDGLNVKKEHGGMVGMLFKATGAIVKLPLQKATAFATLSSCSERAMCVYVYVCLALRSVLAHSKSLICFRYDCCCYYFFTFVTLLTYLYHLGIYCQYFSCANLFLKSVNCDLANSLFSQL